MRMAFRATATATALALSWAAAVGCSSGGHKTQSPADAPTAVSAAAQPAPAASASPAASVKITQAALNEDVDGARVVLSSNSPLLYTSYEPRPDLLIVDLRDTTMAAGFQAPAAPGGGLVESIKFEELDELGKRITRLSIAHNPDSKPDVRSVGQGLAIAFSGAAHLAAADAETLPEAPPSAATAEPVPAAAAVSSAPLAAPRRGFHGRPRGNGSRPREGLRRLDGKPGLGHAARRRLVRAEGLRAGEPPADRGRPAGREERDAAALDRGPGGRRVPSPRVPIPVVARAHHARRDRPRAPGRPRRGAGRRAARGRHRRRRPGCRSVARSGSGDDAGCRRGAREARNGPLDDDPHQRDPDAGGHGGRREGDPDLRAARSGCRGNRAGRRARNANSSRRRESPGGRRGPGSRTGACGIDPDRAAAGSAGHRGPGPRASGQGGGPRRATAGAARRNPRRSAAGPPTGPGGTRRAGSHGSQTRRHARRGPLRGGCGRPRLRPGGPAGAGRVLPLAHDLGSPVAVHRRADLARPEGRGHQGRLPHDLAVDGPEHRHRPGGARNRDRPARGRAVGPGPRPHPQAEQPRLRAREQHHAHRDDLEAPGRGVRPRAPGGSAPGGRTDADRHQEALVREGHRDRRRRCRASCPSAARSSSTSGRTR